MLAQTLPLPVVRDDSERALMSAMLVTLLVLALLRLGATLAPGMWFWALNPTRFAAPAIMFPGLLIPLVLLLGSVAQRLSPSIARLGNLTARSPWTARAIAAAAAAAIVLLLPDRTLFTNDFALSQLALQRPSDPTTLMPQAFPLTLWFHFAVPHQLSAAMGVSAISVAKVEATLEAAAFGLLGVELSRTLGLSGAAAVVSVTGVIFGGSLAVFSGLEKSFGELAVLGTLLGICSLNAWRHGRGALIGGLAFALALLIHRSALLFAPIYAWICLRCWQQANDRKWAVLLGIAGVLAALVISRADYARALQFDRGFGYFGWPASGLDVGLDTIDMANVLLLLSPLIPLAWVVRSQARVPILLPLSTILPGLVLLCGTRHSYHGLFRDWDIFTGALSPLFVLVAGSIGLGLQSHGRAAGRVAPAILAAAVVPTLFWLWAHVDADRGFRQVHAFVTEDPLRSSDVRGRSWQFLCSRYVDLRRFPEAVTAGRKAAELAPSHDLLLVLAGSERNAGDPRAALGTYRRVAALVPEDLVAWYNITTLSAELGDASAAEDGLARLGALGAAPDVVAYARAIVQRRRRL